MVFADCRTGAILSDAVTRNGAGLTGVTSWFRFMQLSDATGEPPATTEGLIFQARADRKFLGEGGLDVSAVVNRLPAMPYALEIPNEKLALSMSPIEIAKTAIDTARRYLEAARSAPATIPN